MRLVKIGAQTNPSKLARVERPLEGQVVNPADGKRSVADRLITAIGEPIPIEGTPATVYGSIGIAVADGAGTDPIDLLRAADAAMYTAKRNRAGLVFAE